MIGSSPDHQCPSDYSTTSGCYYFSDPSTLYPCYQGSQSSPTSCSNFLAQQPYTGTGIAVVVVGFVIGSAAICIGIYQKYKSQESIFSKYIFTELLVMIIVCLTGGLIYVSRPPNQCPSNYNYVNGCYYLNNPNTLYPCRNSDSCSDYTSVSQPRDIGIAIVSLSGFVTICCFVASCYYAGRVNSSLTTKLNTEPVGVSPSPGWLQTTENV